MAHQLFNLPPQKPLSAAGRVLPGAKLAFYLTTTSTPADVYTTSALNVAHTQPVEADVAGLFPTIYLDPEVVYKATLSDANDVLQYTQDPVNDQILSQAVIGGYLYPQTDAEESEAITPVNNAYPPGYPERYGTNTTPGTTDMTAAINAAFKLAKTSGAAVILGTTWPYLVTSAIDCTQDSGDDNFAFVVRNVGQAHAVTESAPGYPLILASHSGHVFDCTGAPAITWYDVSVGEKTGATEKQTCWLLARNSGGGSQIHRFYNCRVRGQFSKAIIYNYGSEEESLIDCVFVNISTTAGSKVVYWTANNILSLTSSFVTIATGAQSNIAHTVIGGSYYNFNTSNTSDVFAFDNMRDARFISIFAVNKGRATWYVDPTNGSTDRILARGCEIENSSPLGSYGVYFGSGSMTCADWNFTGCYMPSNTRAIKADTNVVLTSCRFESISELSSKGLEVVTRLQQSTVDQVSVLVIGESKQNSLTGDTSAFTITTRTNDNWYETGATNVTWTPGTGSITHGGTLTVGNKRLALNGKKMFFSFSLIDTVSMSWAAKTAITGLPFTAVIVSADVSVTNYSTGASLGTGYVEGTSIYLPVNAGSGASEFVIISGSCYVA